MRHRNPTLAAAGIGLALAVTLTACGASSGTTTGDTSAAADVGATAGDVAFAQLMIPHHAQAVDMADMALEQAQSDDVRRLAEQIRSAQDPEITTMTGWLQDWGAPPTMPGSDADGMPGMDHSGHDMGGVTTEGMMSADDMAALAQARGTEFDRMWLEMMIAHHEGAVTMARQVLATTTEPAVTTLARDVVEGQTAEITTMRQLLNG